MRRRLLLGLVPALPLLALAGSCGADADAPVSIGLVLRAPAGLLDQANAIRLQVFDASKASCQATGHVSTVPAGAQTFALQSTGCAAGVAWCKDITLDKDGSTKMFAVVASNAAGILAEGCATATINQDPLEVDIQVQRYLSPACCGNGKLEPGEQCESATTTTECPGIAADTVCAADCTSIEIPVDRKVGAPRPAVATKSELAIAFCPGAPDYGLQNGLRAVFTDTAAGTSGGADVAIRAFDAGLHPLQDPSLILPEPHPVPLLCSDAKATKGSVNAQRTPSIAPIGADLVAVVYVSDELTATHDDIFLSAQGLDGCAEKAPVRVNDNSGAASPDVAAGGIAGTGLVVWTRAGQVLGRLVARTVDAGDVPTLTPQGGGSIAIAPNGAAPRVAGSASGWVVAYQGAGAGDGDGIFVRTVSPGGVVGPEIRVNTATDGVQEQPDVAMLSDGRFVVVWRSAGDVWLQRFDAAGQPAAHDQDEPLNTVRDDDQARPAVAASGDLGQFYVAAWESRLGGNGAIAARIVGGDSGFGYNSVSGQNDEFEASVPGAVGERRRPAVAIGGGGYVAIGWQDEAAAQPGLVVRRFPLPM
jgi:hypothetical protein